MKHKYLTFIALAVLTASIAVSFLTFEKQTGKKCGTPNSPTRITKHTYQFIEWYSADDKDISIFMDCIGPKYYLIYRPIDVSIAGIIVSGVLFYFVKKNKK